MISKHKELPRHLLKTKRKNKHTHAHTRAQEMDTKDVLLSQGRYEHPVFWSGAIMRASFPGVTSETTPGVPQRRIQIIFA